MLKYVNAHAANPILGFVKGILETRSKNYMT